MNFGIFKDNPQVGIFEDNPQINSIQNHCFQDKKTSNPRQKSQNQSARTRTSLSRPRFARPKGISTKSCVSQGRHFFLGLGTRDSHNILHVRGGSTPGGYHPILSGQSRHCWPALQSFTSSPHAQARAQEPGPTTESL